MAGRRRRLTRVLGDMRAQIVQCRSVRPCTEPPIPSAVTSTDRYRPGSGVASRPASDPGDRERHIGAGTWLDGLILRGDPESMSQIARTGVALMIFGGLLAGATSLAAYVAAPGAGEGDPFNTWSRRLSLPLAWCGVALLGLGLCLFIAGLA